MYGKKRSQLPPVSPVDTKVIFYLHSPSHSHHFEFQCITNCICSCSSLSFCLIPLFVPVGYLSFSLEKPRFEQIKHIITNGSHIHVVCSKLSHQCSGNNLAVSLSSCLKDMKLSKKTCFHVPKITLGTAGVRHCWKEKEGRKKEGWKKV